MKRSERILLPVAGILLFLALWQAVILVTRPPLMRRTTLGIGATRDGHVGVAILGDKGEVLIRKTLPQRGVAESLGGWLASFQPTLAAVPPGDDAGTRVLQAAKRASGLGLELQEIAIEAPGDTAAEALSRATQLQRSRSVRQTWLPDPIEALVALFEMVKSGEMLRHIVASLFRVATGFTLAAGLGIPFGFALGSFARLNLVTNSVIQALRPISPIAWLPAATLALGGGDLAAVFLIFLAAFFPIAVSTAAAVANVDQRYRRSAQNFGVKGMALALRVVLPAALPAILTALRIGMGIAWVVVVAAEMLGVESGLGYLVLDARNQLRYDRVVAAMIAIGLIGMGLDALVCRFEYAELERRGMRPQ